MVYSNVVEKEALRRIQSETLAIISDALLKSFGPYGSNSIIGKDGALSRYTKDGHTILSNLQFVDPIAKAVHADIEEETLAQAKKVGDSTTSITLLSSAIFDALSAYEKEHNYRPASIVKAFKNVAEMIKNKIKENGREATIEDMYNITLIATNGDENLAKILNQVYKTYGLDVYIDVKASMNGTTYLKEINGMTMECGFLDPTLINDTTKNAVDIKNPKIYAFKDPIDTAEMGMFLDAILVKNILKPISEKKPENIVPTIIMAPRISRDYSAYMDTLMASIAQAPAANRGILNIITDIQGCDMEQFEDICDLCGCKYIKKYLDPEIQKKDIEAGLAPTPDNIETFAGEAELVSSDAYKTTFVNPKKMFNSNGKHSELFNQRTDYLQKQIEKLTIEGNTTTEIYTLKKRLNSLKGKMVEIYIGGVTIADRDAERDLLEDAVLNCRSAAINGVGYAANFEGYRAALSVTEDELTGIEADIADILVKQYYEIVYALYDSVGEDEIDNPHEIIKQCIVHGCPYNITTGKYDGKVLTSIDTDICIIDTISKIITIMVTANQFILPTINMNNY
jgi:chaperonin GroEL (HSP60 family)